MSNELEAGPELDAAVAKAIGLSGTLHGDPVWAFIVDPREHRDLFGVERLTNSTWGGDGLVGDNWSPSTDLNAAFEAAEKCPGSDSIHVEREPNLTWYANIGGSYECGPTACVAICRAILDLAPPNREARIAELKAEIKQHLAEDE